MKLCILLIIIVLNSLIPSLLFNKLTISKSNESIKNEIDDTFKILFMYKKQSYNHETKNAMITFNYKNLVFTPHEVVFYTSPHPNVQVFLI